MNYYGALHNLSLDGAGDAASAPQMAEAQETVEAAQPRRGSADGGSDVMSPDPAQPPLSPPEATATEPGFASRTLIKNALIWVDLEMTGLDLDRDTIIEIAVILTDSHLGHEILGPELVIHQPDEVLAGMNEWCQVHHGGSGLTDRVRASSTTMQEAEDAVLEFVQQYTDATTRHHLAGSSVHVDLTFLRRHMPKLAALLPYRVVDVSTVMELCRRWFPQKFGKAPRKRLAHTALSDIQDSIRQLRWYKANIFKPILPLAAFD